MRSFITCTPQQHHLGDSIKAEIGGAHNRNGRDQKGIQSFGRKTRRKELLGRLGCR
jgi:hypothetical protein